MRGTIFVLTLIALSCIGATVIQIDKDGGTNYIIDLGSEGVEIVLSPYSNTTLNVTGNQTLLTNTSRPSIPKVIRPIKNIGVFKEPPKSSRNELIQKASTQAIRTIIVEEKIGSLSGKQSSEQSLRVQYLRADQIQALPKDVIVVEDVPVQATLTESKQLIGVSSVQMSTNLTGAVNICIVDSGLSDASLTSRVLGQYDFVNDDATAEDNYNHGTYITQAIADVAPGASFYLAKVLDGTGVGYSSDVIEAIEWCEGNGVDIISLSLGAEAYESWCDDASLLAQAANYAAEQNITVVAAAGNDGPGSMRTPACASKVLSVGAIYSWDQTVWGGSSISNVTDILAPGVAVNVLGPAFTGTSISTAITSGAIAHILEDAALTPLELIDLVRRSGTSISYLNQTYPLLNISAAQENTTLFSSSQTGFQDDESQGSLAITAQLADGSFCANDGQCTDNGGTSICWVNYFRGVAQSGHCVPNNSYCGVDIGTTNYYTSGSGATTFTDNGEDFLCVGDNVAGPNYGSAWIADEGRLEIRNSTSGLVAIVDKYGSMALRRIPADTQISFDNGWRIQDGGGVTHSIDEDGDLKIEGTIIEQQSSGGTYDGLIVQNTSAGGKVAFRANGDLIVWGDFASNDPNNPIWS